MLKAGPASAKRYDEEEKNASHLSFQFKEFLDAHL